jgi:hypothetical protein
MSQSENTFRGGARKTYSVSLDVHHIWNGSDHSVKNLMTVCRKCHLRLHALKRKDPVMYEWQIQQNIREFLSINSPEYIYV